MHFIEHVETPSENLGYIGGQIHFSKAADKNLHVTYLLTGRFLSVFHS